MLKTVLARFCLNILPPTAYHTCWLAAYRPDTLFLSPLPPHPPHTQYVSYEKLVTLFCSGGRNVYQRTCLDFAAKVCSLVWDSKKFQVRDQSFVCYCKYVQLKLKNASRTNQWRIIKCICYQFVYPGVCFFFMENPINRRRIYTEENMNLITFGVGFQLMR